jgi:hypothetical protein
MRGTKIQGRFTIPYERDSMYEGMTDELRDPVGVFLDWYVWDSVYLAAHTTDVVDDIYDTSNPTPGKGRRWKDKLIIPAITAQLFQGQIVQNERGFYNTDTLRIVLNVGDISELLPDLTSRPDTHIKDRIVFRNEVFIPVKVYPRGHLGLDFAVVTVDCNQVNPEEMVNDPQFQAYAQ